MHAVPAPPVRAGDHALWCVAWRLARVDAAAPARGASVVWHALCVAATCLESICPPTIPPTRRKWSIPCTTSQTWHGRGSMALCLSMLWWWQRGDAATQLAAVRSVVGAHTVWLACMRSVRPCSQLQAWPVWACPPSPFLTPSTPCRPHILQNLPRPCAGSQVQVPKLQGGEWTTLRMRARVFVCFVNMCMRMHLSCSTAVGRSAYLPPRPPPCHAP